MQKASVILGLACQAIRFGILVVKFIEAVHHLVGGATTYPCCTITSIRLHATVGEFLFPRPQAALSE